MKIKSSIPSFIQELETISQNLGISLVYEKIQSHHPRKGALCRIRGNWKLIIDRNTSPDEKFNILLDNISLFENEHIFITPRMRDMLIQRRSELVNRGKKLPGLEVNE